MPRTRPAKTGYERLAQADDQFSDDSELEDDIAAGASLQPASAGPRYASIIPPRAQAGMQPSANATGNPAAQPGRPRRRRSSSGVDLKAINARLERWAEEIASKFKRSKRKQGEGDEDERLEIQHSVFQAPDGVRPVTPEFLSTVDGGYMQRDEFEHIVESVRVAIEQGVHPRMITQGSSGSYFAQNLEGKVVGVFKPKDEEPYAAGNPKWNKWIHRNLFPCCFGRACLIPNLSYVSEAAAYTLDSQLRTHLVPYTDVVYLSSRSFHYPFWDRYNHSRNRKPLPAKPGSFQVFLKGFKDANVFLKEHPWPDQYWSGFLATGGNETHRNRRKRWRDTCQPSSRKTARAEGGDGDDSDEEHLPRRDPAAFVWTDALKQSFREELEKLVILDYIMRNTDRGLDNWMVRVDPLTQQVTIASDPIQLQMAQAASEAGPRPVDLSERQPQAARSAYPYHKQKPMDASSPSNGPSNTKMTLGAIDNSLSWPWKHPDAWRSFPFGWLFLPVDLIGRPFSQKTRDHFLPLLTSTHWWSQTQLALRKVFQLDPDFQERMFARQIAVMKGQAWNVVETLKTPDHGPLELTRRAKVCVWDDLVDVPVAVPMRAPSAEMLRRTADGEPEYFNSKAVEEEMDIGAASSSAAHGEVEDLLTITTPPSDLPHPGRFDIVTPTEEHDFEDEGEQQQQQQQHATPQTSLSSPAPRRQRKPNNADGSTRRPGLPRGAVAASYHGSPRSVNFAPARQNERRYSFATATARRNSGSLASHFFGYDDDDDDELHGDLGYAAAEGMEGHQRKVIVERLEAVKSKNPVFTWC